MSSGLKQIPRNGKSTVVSIPLRGRAIGKVSIPGDKELIKRIFRDKSFDKYGILNTTLTDKDIDRLTPEELYEVLYGGSSDFWNSNTFEEERIFEYNFISDLTREINVVKSIYKCLRTECGYDRIIVRQEQKSAGDESMTTSYRCTRCGYSWSSRG